ncbi:MAG TPA: hypothetical protein VE596_01365 [Gaiellaceae bacterium]|jgi:hypothetical protein|nr:hypothetical protein [Gaiellaceae bacterium]
MQTPKASAASLEAAVAARSDDTVVRWRLIVLLRAGYSWDEAVELATETRVDLHFAAELLGKGCPSEIARRILI